VTRQVENKTRAHIGDQLIEIIKIRSVNLPVLELYSANCSAQFEPKTGESSATSPV
jgi:hypothetical protein